MKKRTYHVDQANKTPTLTLKIKSFLYVPPTQHSVKLNVANTVYLWVSLPAIIFMNCVDHMIFVMEKCYVFFEAGTQIFKHYLHELRALRGSG
jgi:hypothetical protein